IDILLTERSHFLPVDRARCAASHDHPFLIWAYGISTISDTGQNRKFLLQASPAGEPPAFVTRQRRCRRRITPPCSKPAFAARPLWNRRNLRPVDHITLAIVTSMVHPLIGNHVPIRS